MAIPHCISPDKISGCLFGGAIGDALGAPIEGIFKLDKVLEAVGGEGGLRDYLPYSGPRSDGSMLRPGIITDDTTMLAATIDGMLRGLRHSPKANPDFNAHIAPEIWASYLQWGAAQDETICAPKALEEGTPIFKNFCFRTGAGKGTIAVLRQAIMGTPDRPVTVDDEVQGKKVTGSNKGCGPMMRTAPFAFYAAHTGEDAFDLAYRGGMMSHNHEAALCAGLVTHIIAEAAQAQDPDICDVLRTAIDSHVDCLTPAIISSCEEALRLADQNKSSAAAIDALGREPKGKNPFESIPVLSQVVYALASFDPEKRDRAEAVLDCLALAACHSGDSDSVAAIVGNVLGAAYGFHALPKHLVEGLEQKEDIAILCQDFQSALATHAAPASAMSRKADVQKRKTP